MLYANLLPTSNYGETYCVLPTVKKINIHSINEDCQRIYVKPPEAFS